MAERLTVLWFVKPPGSRDKRFRHVVADPERMAGSLTRLLAEGAVLAVVDSDDDGQRAIANGADEYILASECSGEPFESMVQRTTTRARARQQRDLFLIDLVRKDDTTGLELLSAALGSELLEPLSRAKRESDELFEQLSDAAERGLRAREIAESVSRATRAVERMRELVCTEPADETVDLAEVTRGVTDSLAAGVRQVAEFEVDAEARPCLVGMPRWQAVMMVASLVANAVESITAQGCAGRKIWVTVTDQDEAAVLEVGDNGPGMEESVRPYASDPFFTTSGKGRLGLGLTVVSARVRRAGGELIIESDPGLGTTVRVFLPLGVSR